MNTILTILSIFTEIEWTQILSQEEWTLLGGGILLWMLILFFSGLYVFLIRIYIAYKMAKNRRRDPLPWVMLSFFVSPVLTWIILLLVGNEK